MMILSNKIIQILKKVLFNTNIEKSITIFLFQ